ncbi:50S ribosomal protein L11 methyltransferase [Robiginitalea sp. SC105]|uniref:50S ribosomal protein L11 methyltransferase n=1 Tax=Robiginitalea sp. SC105 TaxID=2762332 RepID=UPI0016396CB9|nr:50S ribosomal protein L11 methyltransferase [Robiginitalea sp. SC105]MBC2839800.1 50S ribosomal protein L11 methyltransferase [Robiginitalea sp. SC105]
MYICCSLTLQPLQPASDIFIATLGELGFESFEETPEGLRAYIPEKDWDEPAVAGLPYWTSPDWEASYQVERIPRQNWNAVWESGYPPIRVGSRCMVRAPFHPPAEGVNFDLVIAPKMSFGTGHHQTTWLMLDFILDLDLEGRAVLDMGAGTGVLAILAARRGATPVLAVDIDPWSAENCRENAVENGVPAIEAVVGDARAIGGRNFDCILANINKNTLLADLPRYEAALRGGGRLLLSGFYVSDLDDLREAAGGLGLVYQSFRERENWVAALFEKPDGSGL